MHKDKKFFAKGQSAFEYSLVFGIGLMIMLVAFIFVLFLPNFIHSAEEQRSIDAWSDSRPFSVPFFSFASSMPYLEIINNEPVSLTITGIGFGSARYNFYSHSVPFNPAGVPACSSGACSMVLYPGQKIIVSFPAYASSAFYACKNERGAYVSQRRFKVPMFIEYVSATGKSGVQKENFPLIGKCV